jgi:hypothetical protein
MISSFTYGVPSIEGVIWGTIFLVPWPSALGPHP